MTTPYDPAAQDAAVQWQLAQQAQAVQGQPSAGIYGDPAGAAQPSAATLDLGKAQATAVDVEALLGQLQELQARAQAAVDAANPPPAEPDTSLHMDSGAPGYLHTFKDTVEARLAALEVKAGLRKADEPADTEGKPAA
jgi:hypothetical protein